MIVSSILLFGAALLPLALITMQHGFRGLALAAGLLWLVSIPVALTKDSRLAHLLAILTFGYITFVTFSGISFVLCLVSMTAALLAWDASLASSLFSGPTEAASGVGPRYMGMNLLYAIVSIAAVVVARLATVPLTFGTGLFVALAALGIAGLILRQIRGGPTGDESPGEIPSAPGSGPESPRTDNTA